MKSKLTSKLLNNQILMIFIRKCYNRTTFEVKKFIIITDSKNMENFNKAACYDPTES